MRTLVQFSALFVIWPASTLATPADGYPQQLKQLDDSRPESVCIARDSLRKRMPESSVGQRDKMLRAFRAFYIRSVVRTAPAFLQLMNKYVNDYENSTSLSTRADFAREFLQARPDIAATGSRWFHCGFLLHDAEGTMYPATDPAALLEFAGKLSTGLGSYIRFRSREDREAVVDDAAIEISWEQLRLRLERWEGFARSHPDLLETKSEVEPEIRELAQLYLFGCDNTPTFDSGNGQIDPALIASWSEFAVHDRVSRYYPLISPLLKNINAHNRAITQQDRPLFAQVALGESFDQWWKLLQFRLSGH
jgi:hypothetical protein